MWKWRSGVLLYSLFISNSCFFPWSSLHGKIFYMHTKLIRHVKDISRWPTQLLWAIFHQISRQLTVVISENLQTNGHQPCKNQLRITQGSAASQDFRGTDITGGRHAQDTLQELHKRGSSTCTCPHAHTEMLDLLFWGGLEVVMSWPFHCWAFQHHSALYLPIL